MLKMAEDAAAAAAAAAAVFFPWSDLPSHVQDLILSFLPIPTLLLCKSVSRAFRSAIRSLPSATASPYFIFSPPTSNSDPLLFFAPSVERWRRLLLPACPPSSLLSILSLTSSSSLLFSLGKERFTLFDPFSRSSVFVPPPTIPMPGKPYPLTLVEAAHDHAVRQIVIVSTTDRIDTQVFDVQSGSWEPKGAFFGRFHLLGNAASVDGSLFFVLSRGPDRLLTFDSVDGSWDVLGVAVPPIRHSHLLAFFGRLFLVGGVEEEGVMARIGVWELDAARTAWKLLCFMPEAMFEKFTGGRELRRFETCGRSGIACFYCEAAGQVLMFDLPARRWWWPRDCPVAQQRKPLLVLHAVEPSVDLLRR